MFSSRLSYYLRIAAIAFAFLLFFRMVHKRHNDAAESTRNDTSQQSDFLQAFEDDDELLKYSNVYFIESAAPFRPVVTIKSRHACAIEAAARANPRKNVIVLLASWEEFTDADHLQIPDLLTLASFRNVHFRWLDLKRFAKGTPGETVITSDRLYEHPDDVAYLSEVLRMVLLYKFGGIYLDLDVITLKPLDLYGPNFFGARSSEFADTSVIGLQQGGYGQYFAQDYLKYVLDYVCRDIQYFHEANEIRNGTTFLTNKLLVVCEKVTVQDIVEHGCFGRLDVYPPNIFHPFDETNVRAMFDASKLEMVKSIIADSMTVHMHHHTSQAMQTDLNGETGYEMIAKKYCPSVYQDNEGNF